jgi:hypothetical protein
MEQSGFVDKDLGVELTRGLHSGAKDTSAAAAEGRCHRKKARVITAEDVVHLQ